MSSTAKHRPSFDVNRYIDADFIHSMLSSCLPKSEFRNDYLLSELLTKLPRKGVSAAERADNAIKKMLESEDVCRSINNDGYRCNTPRNYFSQIMLLASSTIAEILGEFSYGLFEDASFSSGATVSRTRKFGDPYYKYHSTKPVSVTPGCYKYAYSLITATPLWCSIGSWDNIDIVAGNSITTVPKKTEIDRCIAKEPCLNMALQRSIGNHIRKRLRKYGVNLSDQSINQNLAHIGSRDGTCATIDLASASDTISDRVVWDLLPHRWYTILDELRSKRGKLPSGELITWEKFSSMGNGFTFELESLIFYAVSRAVVSCNGDDLSLLSVYGDDIIVPTQSSRNLITVLSDLGFSTNVEKSFIEGPFRESCGKHYYEGVDVTPFYIRKEIDSLPRVIWFLNSLRKWATIPGLGADPRVYPFWSDLKRSMVPKFLLGGNSFENPGSLVSPEQPRKKLVPRTKNKRIDGIRGLLRSFQNKGDYQFVTPFTRNLHKSYLTWEELQVDTNVSSTKYPSIGLLIPNVYGLSSNDDASWWDSPALFPQEVV